MLAVVFVFIVYFSWQRKVCIYLVYQSKEKDRWVDTKQLDTEKLSI